MKKQVSDNPEKNRKTDRLFVITALMITLYIASNAMSVKIIAINNFALFDAGTITFPFAYMLGDVLAEIWGFKTARKVIFLTFLCNIIFILCTTLGIFVPSPDYMKETAEAYSCVFGYVPRIVAASLVAYLAGELLNAWVLDRIKQITGKKNLWLRTIGSSAIAYIADTGIFILAAFWKTATPQDMLSMFVVSYIAKLAIEAFFGTPLAYAAVRILEK